MASVPPKASDSDAEFRAFFRAHLAYVCESLRRLGVQSRDAEDLAHEVFMAVHRRFDELDRSRPPRPWLFAFALRSASGYRQRARVVRETVGIDGEVAADQPDAEAQLARDGDRRTVYEALATLPIERRAIFVMHELDERPVPDIARELEIPVQTAYSRLRVAKDEFVAAVRRQAMQQRTREGGIHGRA